MKSKRVRVGVVEVDSEIVALKRNQDKGEGFVEAFLVFGVVGGVVGIVVDELVAATGKGPDVVPEGEKLAFFIEGKGDDLLIAHPVVEGNAPGREVAAGRPVLAVDDLVLHVGP